MTCAIEGCVRPQGRARGYCTGHYERWRQSRRGVMPDWQTRPFRRRNGSGSVNWAGYITVYQPQHPNAGAGGCVLEHVLVMSQYLGRPLLPEENVHHKNGDRRDNRLMNLELWSTKQPPGQRVADKVQYAHEILALYGGGY